MLTREQIYERVWGSWGDRSAVAVYVRRLREKLEDVSAELIVTVWGVGYRFDPRPMTKPSLHVWLALALALAAAAPAAAGTGAWVAAGAWQSTARPRASVLRSTRCAPPTSQPRTGARGSRSGWPTSVSRPTSPSSPTRAPGRGW